MLVLLCPLLVAMIMIGVIPLTILKIYLSPMMNMRLIIMLAIILKVGLEECQLCMHVDHVEKILCESYIVEFEYDPTCNYYERGKYGCRNFHVTKLPLVMLKSSMFYSAPLHMLEIACLDNLFAYKMPMHRKYVRLKYVFHMLHDALFVFQLLSFM